MTKASVFGKQNYTNPETDRVIAESGTKFTAKVFLYMFIALAITAITTIIGSVVLSQAFIEGSESAGSLITGSVITLAVIYIPLIIWIEISVLRGGKGLVPAFVIYSIMMGLIIAPVVWIFDITGSLGLVAMAFGITTGTFGIMALISWTTKKDLSGLAVLGIGFAFGSIMIMLISLIMGLCGLTMAEIMLDALASLGFFIFVLLISFYDFYNIRRIAARGGTSNNLAMVCAFSLYTDFVYIFIRVLIFIARIAAMFGRNN